jgi:hypothetical protein
VLNGGGGGFKGHSHKLFLSALYIPHIYVKHRSYLSALVTSGAGDRYLTFTSVPSGLTS